MRFEPENKTIVKSDQFKESTFTIAANAKAFDILSSKLYTDVIQAIVRELSTNAWDAHIDAKNEQMAFHVHLPTNVEPHFSIRDFGKGISPEDIKTIYTTYFASTRNTSNKFVGALGLGSKSPFAYTDQFAVISRHEGTEYTYSALKNEDGEPTILLLSEQATTEPSGLEIKISTNYYDSAKFYETAKNVYRWFPVKPILNVPIDFNFGDPEFSTPAYQFYDHSSRYIKVIMGNVCYDVDTAKYRGPKRGTLYMFVDIGEVSVAASREELHYDKKTHNTLVKYIEEAYSSIVESVEKKIGEASTKLEKQKLINKFSEVVALGIGTFPLDFTLSCTSAKELYQHRKRAIGIDVHCDVLKKVYPTQNYFFIEKDIGNDPLEQKYRSRLANFYETHRGTVFLVEVKDHNQFLEDFGPITAKLSELPQPPRNQNTSAFRTFIRKHDSGHNWKPIYDEPELEGAIAVRRYHNDATLKDNSIIYDVRRLADMMGYQTIYGIANSQFEKIRNKLGLPDLETEIKKFTENFIKNADNTILVQLNHNCDNHVRLLINEIEEFDPDFAKLQELSSEFRGTIAVIKQLASAFNIPIPEVPNTEKIFFNKYPMLRYTHIDGIKPEDLKQYMQQCHES